MARKGVKQLQEAAEKATKIRCMHCDLSSTCSRKDAKVSYEGGGWMTRCVMTPNRPGKKGKPKSQGSQK